MATLAVLGCDVSLTSTGLAVVEFAGRKKPVLLDARTIATSPKQGMGERLTTIRRGIEDIVKDYAIVNAGVETGFVLHNSTSLLLAQARGVVVQTLHSSGVGNVVDINNSTAKSAVNATGGGTKKERKARVLHGVCKAVNQAADAALNDDEADAVAVALAAKNVICSPRQGSQR